MRMWRWLVMSVLVAGAGCPAPPQNVVQVCTTTCPAGMVCAPLDGTTLEVCVYEASGVRCAPGEVLLNGACVAAQRRGRACTTDEACGPGYECRDDPQQVGARVCWPKATDVNGTIDGQVFACTADEKPLGDPPALCLATCQGAICATDEACAKTVAGDACAALDPLGRTCSDDSHCAATSDRIDPPLPPYYCAQGRCLPRMVACAGDVDCPAGFVCDATRVCVERPPEPVPTFTYCRDADEDGYCIDDGCQVMAAPGPASPPRWRADCGVFERASCDAQAGANPGVDEVCNGLDDDCDGNVDEALGAPIGTACGGTGSCSAGTFACVAGQVVCQGSTGGQPETCNGVDDDCDSIIDELPLPGVGGTCTDPGFETIGDTGECEFGALVCENGQIACDGYVGPRPEVCNGLDDDCDGQADATATCPAAGQMCIAGECASPCAPSEFPCPFGFYCEMLPTGNFCLHDPCADVTCPAGAECDRADGQCHDLCDGITCGPGLECFGGICQDCFALGCDAGELCVRNQDNIGVCVPDPCFGVMCEANQACRDGTCVAVTCDPACPDGQRCADGVCVADACAGVTCPSGRVCDPADGQCVADRCTRTTCAPGLACRPSDGVCIPDPCLTIQCPAPLVCDVDFDGVGACVPPPGPGGEVITAAGGGCATGGADAGLGPLALALVALARRRRARAA